MLILTTWEGVSSWTSQNVAGSSLAWSRTGLPRPVGGCSAAGSS